MGQFFAGRLLVAVLAQVLSVSAALAACPPAPVNVLEDGTSDQRHPVHYRVIGGVELPIDGASEPSCVEQSGVLRGDGETLFTAEFKLRTEAPGAYLTTFSAGYRRICVQWPGEQTLDCAGYSTPRSGRSIQYKYPVFPVPALLDGSESVFITAIPSPGVAFELFLVDPSYLLDAETAPTMVQGAFYGVLALACLACFVTFAGLRDATYLWFGAHLLAIGMAFLGFTGWGSAYVPALYGPATERLSLAFLAAGFGFMALFTRAFLVEGHRGMLVDRALLAVAGIAGVAVLVSLMGPLATTETVVAAVALISLVAMLVSSFHSAIVGYRPALALLAASVVFVLGTSVTAANILGWTELPSDLALTAVRGGAVVAAVAMTLGLGYRTYLFRLERDAAIQNAMTQNRIALHRANHDETTGFTTRRRFLELGSEILATTEPNDDLVCVWVIELDNFAALEKTYAYRVVDRVVKTLARRLQAHCGPNAVLGRHRTDAFTVLERAPATGGAHRQMLSRAEAVMTSLSSPIEVGKEQLRVPITIGVAERTEDTASFEEMLASANRAMLEGGRRGGNQVILYERGAHDDVNNFAALQGELWHALAADEFSMVYQPIFSVSSGECVGHEALLRWQHPQRGIVLPERFLPQIEGSDLMVQIGRWVQDEVCRTIAKGPRWLRGGLPISINVSAIELQQADFVDELRQAMRQYDVPASALELELTETCLMQNIDHAAAVLERCQSLGIDTRVDDFGTGYSSLSYLRSLPLVGLKIDRVFVSRIERSAEDQAIVRSIIELAHNLRLSVVAEGVETDGQQAFLKQAGCDYLQGHGLTEPMAI